MPAWFATAALTLVLAITIPEGMVRAASALPDYKSLAYRVADSLSKGQYETIVAMNAPILKGKLTDVLLKQVWDGLTAREGAFVGVGETQAISAGSTVSLVTDCGFSNGHIELLTAFDSSGELSGLYVLPGASPVRLPSGLTERTVTVGAGSPWPLPGTLTIPAGKGPFPAVVLVHGSGPEDADETIGANKPFRDLAWGLAQRGVAVLRYEKRTHKYGPAMVELKSFTVDDETIDDAVLAAELLQHTEEIDAKRIVVLGHSLGGMLIPRIAKATPFAAGYIVMAGSTEPLEDVMLRQIKTAYTGVADTFGTVAKTEAEVVEIHSPALTADHAPLLGVPASYWLGVRSLHAAQEALGIHQPMLILQGAADVQVLPSDFDVWRSALTAKKNVTYHRYPGLSHLFMPDQASGMDYFDHPGRVSDQVVADIAAWVKTAAR